jgi:intein-encoded DNA endonuclease-like protein
MGDEIKEHRKNMAKVIAKAWSDESFKRKFLSDPKEVLEENGITLPAELEVKVIEQTDKVMYIVIPFRPDDAEGGSWMCADDAYDPPCVRCV